MKPNLFHTLRGHLCREVIAAWLVAGLLLQSAPAVAPDWWATRGVLTPGATADDYAVANIGQLKTIAQKAALEMNAALPGGAGADINALIDSWTSPPAAGITRDDYAALNLGQLKGVAKLFYDRLAAKWVRPAGSYPWSGSANAADDYAVANLGQLKTVFAFDMTPADVNNNGVPDLWETQMFGNFDQDMDGDFDSDGLSNLAEWQAGTRANSNDTDEDGFSDRVEREHGYNPRSSGSYPGLTGLQFAEKYYRMEHAVIKYPDNEQGQQVWHVNKYIELPDNVDYDFNEVTGDKPPFPPLPPVPVQADIEFPYWHPFHSGRVCNIYEVHVQNEFAEHRVVGGVLTRVRANGQCPSLKERQFGLLLMLSSREVNTNDEFELEETKVVSLTIPAGSTYSAPLEVTLEPEEGREIQVTAHEISFEVPETEPPEFSSGNIFAATTDDVSSVTDQAGTSTGSQPGGVTSGVETYDPGTAPIKETNELKIAKMEGRVDKKGDFKGPAVLPPLDPPAVTDEKPVDVANRQLCIPEHDPDRFRVRVKGVYNYKKKNPGDTELPFSLKLQTTSVVQASGAQQNAAHDSGEKTLKMRKDPGLYQENNESLEYVSEWQLLVSDTTDDQHANRKWPEQYLTGSWWLKVSYTAARTPVYQWINKNTGATATVVPEVAGEDLTHLAELGSKVTLNGETIAAGKITANGKVGFNMPVESGREVKLKVAYAWDVGPQQVFEQIFAQDFQHAKQRWAQAGIRLTLVGELTKIEKPASVPHTQRKKMFQRLAQGRNRHNPELLDLINAAWTGGQAPSNEPECIQVIYIRSLSDEGAPANTTDTSGIAFAPYFSLASPDEQKYPENNLKYYVNNIFISTNRDSTNASGQTDGIVGLGKPFTLAHEIGHLLTNMGHYGVPAAEASDADYIVGVDDYLRAHNLMRRGTSEFDYFHESKRLYFYQKYLMKHTNNSNHNKFK